MKVYFISGLAADQRIFKYIQLPPAHEPVYLNWIKPYTKETLAEYSRRLATRINKDEPFMLIGFSLGGMIATEIARQYSTAKLVLISSIPASTHLPFYFRIIGKVGLHKIVPVSILKSASIVKRFFSPETSADKIYLKQAIRESDPDFVRWAINAILKWKGTQTNECIHIHGSRDLLLPCRYTRPTHLIKGGGHMMILTHGKEISHIIEKAVNAG